MRLTKQVLKSEFPNLNLESKHHKKVTFSMKDGQDIIISKEKDNGDYESELYEFDEVNDNVVWPEPPELPNYWSKVDLDKWNGVIDSDARDDFNKGVKQVQSTVNSLIDYETDQRNYFAKLKDSLSDLKTFILRIISFRVATYLHDEVETKYYDKETVDKKDELLQRQINNLTAAIRYKPDPNGVQAPSYTGDKDINDSISDAKVLKKIEELSDNDMKGENN